MLSPTKLIGTMGELAVAADMLKQGWDVYTSVGDCSTADLVGYRDGVYIRVQVKTASKTWGAVTVGAARVIGRKVVKYQPSDFDVLAIHVLDEKRTAYLPMKLLQQTSMTLRLVPAKSNRKKDIHWFSDFEQCVP